MNQKQEKLLKMMKWFHDLCQNENIRYYAIAGTALGAVRHKGFIPWDDDIDVGVPRKDYERLIQLSTKLQKDSGYAIEFPLQNKDYCYAYGKIYDVNTTHIENNKTKTKRGIYLDIFPLDGIGQTLAKSKKYYIRVLRKINLFRAKYGVSHKKRKFHKNLAIFCVRIIPSFILSKSKLISKINKLCSKNDFENSAYVGNFMGVWKDREIMKNEWFGVPTPMQFEDMQINVPEFYGEYLTKMYGDYMTPPPKEKQITHHDYIYENLNEPYIK